MHTAWHILSEFQKLNNNNANHGNMEIVNPEAGCHCKTCYIPEYILPSRKGVQLKYTVKYIAINTTKKKELL